MRVKTLLPLLIKEVGMERPKQRENSREKKKKERKKRERIEK